MLREECIKDGFRGVRQSDGAQSHAGSKSQDREMASRLYEGWVHERKSDDISEPSQGRSFCRAVRSVESAVQQNSKRKEDRSLSLI